VDHINHERTRVVLCAPRWVIESAAYLYFALPCLRVVAIRSSFFLIRSSQTSFSCQTHNFCSDFILLNMSEDSIMVADHQDAQNAQKRKAGQAGLDGISQPRAVKRRASKACQCCRARKVRCNVTEHGAPCTNCRLDEVECIVSESRRKKSVTSSLTLFHVDVPFSFATSFLLVAADSLRLPDLAKAARVR
jgi:hypothetical protein